MNNQSNSTRFLNNFHRQITAEGKELIYEFMLTYSRFECALKNSMTYLNSRNSKVEANWDLFVSDIRSVFNPEKTYEIRDGVIYLLNHPPKIQIQQNNGLFWQDRHYQDNTPDINKLCQAIRDIRNNLMHGGKFNGQFEPDVSRNYRLLKSGLIILNEWLDLSGPVKQLFHDPIGD